MNEALHTAQACIARAMNALANAGLAGTARAVEDDFAILKAQSLLRHAMSTLGMPEDADLGRHPPGRILMDSVMLDGTGANRPAAGFILSLPDLDAGAHALTT